MLSRIAPALNGLSRRAAPYASLVDRFREAMGGTPAWVVVAVIPTLPVSQLQGGIPAGKAMGACRYGRATLIAIIFNMLPVPFILWFLGPLSRWLSRHSRTMDRFFEWLFARTRRKHSRSFERWKEIALMVFVGIPLPMTGAWSGAVAAFVFDVPFWSSLLFIFLGVLIAAVIVSLATSLSFLVGWQGSLIFFALLTCFLVYVFMRGKRELSEETGTEDGEGASDGQGGNV